MVEHHTCESCGQDFTRPVVRGTKPKTCPTCRAGHRSSRNCQRCGRPGVRRDARFCSRSCAASSRPRKPRPPKLRPQPIDQRSPLRRAVEDGDLADVIAAVRLDVQVNGRGCWIWQRTIDSKGYARVMVGKRTVNVHRLVMGEPSCAVVHHACADTSCVNPDHLQLVTQRENAAEMLERSAYLARIEALEHALAHHDPNHPLLTDTRPGGGPRSATPPAPLGIAPAGRYGFRGSALESA